MVNKNKESIMRTLLLALGFAAAAVAPAQAATVTIDFQDLTTAGNRPSISYPEVTFTNGLARPLTVIRTFSTGDSRICAIGNNFACTGELIATFAKPVNQLQLDVLGVNRTTDIVSFLVEFGAGESETVSFDNLNLGVDANLIDLGQFRDVTRFVLTSTDSNGVSIDNVRFAPVPEPATWAMMIAGFGLAGTALRRRAARIAFA